MQKSLFIILASLLLSKCSHLDNSSKEINQDTIGQVSYKSNESKTIKENEQKSNFEDIPDFFKISKNKKTATLGFLQGVEKSDSSGPYVIKEFFSDTLSFDLLFYPKNGDKNAVNFGSIRNEAANNYQDFICFAFVYPMQDPDKMKDYHADNVTYPVKVKTFARKMNDWEFLSQSTVKNLSELSEYEIKTIYSIIR